MSISRNYAQALYQSLSQGSSTEKAFPTTLAAEEQLELLAKAVKENKHLQLALQSPAVSLNEKFSLIEELGKKLPLSPIIVHYARLLLKKGRLSFLQGIQIQLKEARLSAEGGVLGTLLSPVPLDDQAIQDMRNLFSQKLGKDVTFQVQQDPNLLAGIQVNLGGVTYDGTLRSHLRKLQDQWVVE